MYAFILDGVIWGFGKSKPACYVDAMNWLNEWDKFDIVEKMNNFELSENIYFISKSDRELHEKIQNYFRKNNIEQNAEFTINYGIVEIDVSASLLKKINSDF